MSHAPPGDLPVVNLSIGHTLCPQIWLRATVKVLPFISILPSLHCRKLGHSVAYDFYSFSEDKCSLIW